MNRKGFLRSIFVVAAAPKILLEFNETTYMINFAIFVPTSNPIDQDFFNKAFAKHYNGNKIYKQHYNVDMINEDTMSAWLT